MKKVLIMLAMAFATKSYSQAHTDSSLNTMTKMQLTNVYLDQVVQLAFSTPYTPFTIGVTDSIKGDLDIPVSRYIRKKREEILDMSTKYGETMKEQLYELVPYSDKKDMIHAILFLQEVNGNIKNNVSK
jgi:hypothetical protein